MPPRAGMSAPGQHCTIERIDYTLVRLANTRMQTSATWVALVALVAMLTPNAQAAQPPAPKPQDGLAQALAYTVTLEGNGVYGSGVLIDPDAGLVITAGHVVAKMTAPRATFFDGTLAAARVLEVDPELDLALLEVPAQHQRPRPVFGDTTTLRAGDEVYAIGCPRHLPFTVSRGIVSFVERVIEGAKYLQTDLPINAGNSGGPVVNARGELVGLMSFIYKRAQGLSFAQPIRYATQRFAARLATKAAQR